MQAAIDIRGLTKDYGAGRGLFDLDLQIDAGDVFGYLGPNGAGKTTTIRLLMGMLHPTRGRASIFGLDCHQDAVAVKKQVGYLPGELPQFGGLRGTEVVAYIAGLRGGCDRGLVRQICERLDLDLGRRFREYSRGNKQKLGILLALMHRPRLLILDEPTGGLDPLNQQEFYDLVREARAAGATVLFSSHILSEVEDVCDRVGIIRRGRLVRVAEMEELHDIRYHHVTVEFDGEPPEAEVRMAAGVENLTRAGNELRFAVRGSFQPVVSMLHGHPVLKLISHEPSLEEIFLAYYEDEPAPSAELVPAPAP
ncbi:MAG TPA: ABC transporter ATP-binding protein [Candidatus Dormibacteraeota bacterium]